MTDQQRAKLQAAADFVSASLRTGMKEEEVIARLCSDYGGRLRLRYDGNKLSCAGASASCTWSADKGLLDNWRRTATTRLMATAS